MELRWLWKTLLKEQIIINFCLIIMLSGNCRPESPQHLNHQRNTEKEKLSKYQLDTESRTDFSDFTKLDLRNSETNRIFNKNDEEKVEFLDKISNQPHSRKKRLIWITDDGRLALPPGTTLTFTPTIAMPLVRYPPEGFLSNITISFPVTMDFDKLGLTDNMNPLGVLPPVFARSFGKTAGNLLGHYIADYLHHRRKREILSQEKSNFPNKNFKINFGSDENLSEPKLPDEYRHVFHGGERALLYGIVEDFLATFGMNGKACLLRTICEVHSRSLHQFGVFGEIVKLFLTATKSPFADQIPEYVKAQNIGEGTLGPGECFPYYKDCPRGLFKGPQKHKYSENSEDEHTQDETDELVNKNIEKLQSELRLKNSNDQINEIGNEMLSM